MKKEYNKIISLLVSKKKQIMFALFALFIVIISKNNSSEMLFNGDPLTVATAAKAAAALAGKAAAKGAAVGAASGAINKGEDESRIKSMARGATKGAVNGAVGSVKKSATDSLIPAIKGQGSKNTNPNIDKNTQNLNSSSINGNASEKDNKSKDSSNTNNSKEKNGDKTKESVNNNTLSNDSIMDDDEGLKAVKKTSKKMLLTPLLGFGCIGALLLTFIIAIPILAISFTDPLSTKVVNYQCEDDDTGLCAAKDTFSSFLEKIKNLIVYQEFSRNDEIIIAKVKDVNKQLLKKYMVSIDIPVLISTIMVDSESINNSYDSSGEIILDAKIRKRLDYLYELGELQIEMNEVAFTCMSKNVGGQRVFYKETNYSVNPSGLAEAPCNSATAGRVLKETIYGIDLDRYYEKLKNNKSLLREIYPDLDVNNEELVDLQIEFIKLRKDMFLTLYSNDEIMDIGLGNVPMTLFYDTNVNLTAPLKGSVGVTSPYGQRTGIFGGMHKGIDLVSNDKTIYAAGDGIVTRANTEVEGGKVIEITHIDSTGHQYITQYAHLSQFLVTRGTKVNSGDIIAIMGCTGTMCSGPHLHFQVIDKETNQTYNPANLLTN